MEERPAQSPRFSQIQPTTQCYTCNLAISLQGVIQNFWNFDCRELLNYKKLSYSFYWQKLRPRISIWFLTFSVTLAGAWLYLFINQTENKYWINMLKICLVCQWKAPISIFRKHNSSLFCARITKDYVTQKWKYLLNILRKNRDQCTWWKWAKSLLFFFRALHIWEVTGMDGISTRLVSWR